MIIRGSKSTVVTTVTTFDGKTTKTVRTVTTDADPAEAEKIAEEVEKATEEMHTALSEAHREMRDHMHGAFESFRQGIRRAMTPFERLFREEPSEGKDSPEGKEPEK